MNDSVKSLLIHCKNAIPFEQLEDEIKQKIESTQIFSGVISNEFNIEYFYNLLQNHLQYDDRYFIRSKNVKILVKKTIELRKKIDLKNSEIIEKNHQNLLEYEIIKKYGKEIWKYYRNNAIGINTGKQKAYKYHLANEEYDINNHMILVDKYIELEKPDFKKHDEIHKDWTINKNNINPSLIKNSCWCKNSNYKTYTLIKNKYFINVQNEHISSDNNIFEFSSLNLPQFQQDEFILVENTHFNQKKQIKKISFNLNKFREIQNFFKDLEKKEKEKKNLFEKLQSD
jgi:hypothetical protein